MPDLPSGTVTLLFTDIEGSTQLLRELGDRYAGVTRGGTSTYSGPISSRRTPSAE
jgi:hypothetical protein